MKLPTVALLILLAVVALFTALNWAAFTAPAQLSLIVTTVQAPLGVLMLFLVGAITAAFLAFVEGGSSHLNLLAIRGSVLDLHGATVPRLNPVMEVSSRSE